MLSSPRTSTRKRSAQHLAACGSNRRLSCEPLEDRRLLALFTVTSDGDAGGGTLRQAILDANLAAGTDEIIFDQSLNGSSIYLSTGELTIIDDVTINGSGLPQGITVNAQSSSRIFNIDDGVYSSPINVELDRLTLTGGYAGAFYNGGAIRSRENLTVTGSSISGNSASSGGGIFSAGGNLTVAGSTISGNSAEFGGGIHSDTDLFGTQTTVIINSTLSGNIANSAGGGLLNSDGLTVIANSTITDNFAPAGSGSGVASFGDNVTETQVVSSIISGNAFDSDVDNVGGLINSFTSLDHNLIGGGNAAGEFGGPNDQNYIYDPGLLPLANNGGPTLTHALLSTSPAIDRGFNLLGLAHDQRGAPFLRQNIGFDADVGAFEWQTAYFPLLVDTTVDELDDDYNPGDLSLREAINAANGFYGLDVISFDESGVFASPQVIALTLGELQITDSAIIEAAGANRLTLNALGNSRVLNIDDGVYGSQINVELLGLTLTGGDAGVYGSGGAILSRENLTVTGSTISGNSASVGGGIEHGFGNLTVTDSTISGNSASSGGGIFSAAIGAQTTIINSTLSGNTAGIAGGGLFNLDGLTVIANSTITDNFAPAGSGSGVASFGDNVTATEVVSSIISGNAFDSDVDNVIGAMNSFTSLDFNLIGGGNAAGEFVSANDQNFEFNPGLLPLANNGGPTLTHALLLSSPAIDNGFNAFGLPHDQRGAPFLHQNIGFDADIGALEWQTAYFPLVVDSTLDELDDNYEVGDLSLREAINAANGFFGPDVISFEPGIFAAPQTIALTEGQLDITDAVIIEGPGAGRLTIDAQGNSRVFNIDDGVYGSQIDVELQDLTLTGGYAGAAAAGVGGAILSRENLTVTGSTISGNSAFSGGGGIYNLFVGNLTVTSSTISENSADYGGGIWNRLGNLTVLDSTISGNSADRGGGIYSDTDLLDTQTTAIINSTLSGNTADTFGGGLFNFDGLTVIANSTIIDNFAPAGYGSGVASYGDTLTRTEVASSIISGNAHDSDVDNVIGVINSFTSLDFNLIGGGNAAGVFGGPLDQNYVYDPGLLPLANNGGPTLTHALLFTSPAIDNGFNVFGLPHDQRGAPFLRQNIGFDADVGAFEWQTAYFPLVVDTTLDELDDNYEVGDLSLREAINAANGFYGPDVISFEPGIFATPQTIALTGGQLDITDAVIIEGPGAGRLTIDAQGNSRLLNIDDRDFGSQIDVELSGLTLTGGFAAGIFGSGGAILTSENLTITGSTISGNSAQFGGGIVNELGNLTVIDSTISGNSANDGGGIWSNTEFTFGIQTTIINSTLSGNTAGVAGGGLFNLDGLTVIANSTITNNVAPAGYGSGVAGFGDNSTETQVASSIVAGNVNSDVDLLTLFVNSFTSLDFNLIGSSGTGVLGNFNGPNDLTGITDPLLGPLANNGGPTLTHDLLPTSPAIDGGGDPLGLGLVTDQRGAPFARTFNGRMDIGAFELINGDFDGGGYACSDVDALVAEIVAGTNDPFYDLNSDLLVNHDDLAIWLGVAGVANLPWRNPYLFGDANLDGAVNELDFSIWNANKFTAGAEWCSGDFNADGVVDGFDMLIWNANKFQTSAVMRPVPSDPDTPRTGKPIARIAAVDTAADPFADEQRSFVAPAVAPLRATTVDAVFADVSARQSWRGMEPSEDRSLDHMAGVEWFAAFCELDLKC